ncbi:MAG: N-acetylglucosamine-6-phosphate deacetylase [Firmicutes bacterium]|nr:N-acetylglucosamine-6-phosphate deacetylase [Bacillota bacterium]
MLVQQQKFALSGARIVTPQAMISGHIVVEGGRIVSIQPGVAPRGLENYDMGDDLIVPGFVDLHIHGAGGWDTATPEAALKMAKILAYNGTTSFYPTPATSEMEVFLSALAAVKGATDRQTEMFEAGNEAGAEMLGLHLEGPFLNKAKKGAMPEQYLLAPSLETLSLFEEQAPGLIRRVTIAPEIPGGLELIAELCRRGYVVAGGHTDATAEQMTEGIDAGITVANHMYNAMTPLHHREPGVTGSYLTDDRVTCEIIADGIHVHPLAIEIALRCKGQDNLYLISDAVLAAGLPAGDYQFLGRQINIDDKGVSRLPDGTIAGSTCLMPVGFRTIVETLGHDPVLAARLAATNPARVAGVLERKGTLEPGKDADITVLDKDYNVTYCCVRGVWHKTPDKSATNLYRTEI